MTISDLNVITIAEALECPKGTEVKVRGSITHSLKPRKLWKGISQFIVIKDRTDSIGCNISVKGIEEGFELGENVMVVGERGEYPEKDRRTGQATGGIVKNINGYVESNWMDANADIEEEKARIEEIQHDDENGALEKAKEKTIAQPKYTAETYWKDKFLLDVERQEMYKENNEFIVRECAIKAVTELACSGGSFVKDKEAYYQWANDIVKWIKDEVDEEEFKFKTEANMIISGLSPLKKGEIIDWINEARIGTDIEDDDQFLIKLNVQVLSHQTIKELRETVDIMMKYLNEAQGVKV